MTVPVTSCHAPCVLAVCVQVVDALSAHYLSFASEERTMPVVWQQGLLCFVQRYKHQLTTADRDALKHLTTKQHHYLVSHTATCRSSSLCTVPLHETVAHHMWSISAGAVSCVGCVRHTPCDQHASFALRWFVCTQNPVSASLSVQYWQNWGGCLTWWSLLVVLCWLYGQVFCSNKAMARQQLAL